MKCPGAGQPPRSLYKAISHYRLRNNRPWFSSGWGECNHCRGAYCVKPYKDGLAYVVHHKPISECTEKEQRLNLRRKQRWIIYYNMNHITGAPTGIYGGQIGQFFNVVEMPSYVSSTTSYRGATYSAMSHTFRVEAQSNTQNDTGQYMFQINDQIYLSPTDRMTLVVDYASWNAWNNTITTSNYARIELNNNWLQWTQSAGSIPAYSAGDFNRFVRQQDMGRYQPYAYTAPREDPVAREERRQREAEALFERVQAERRAKEEAVSKAEQTLLSLLTPEQRQEYRARRQFHVRGSKGTLFRIIHGSSGNVRQVLSEADEGRGLHAYCAHPQMWVPEQDREAGITPGHLPHEDAMIAQMLQLMVDEDQFLAVANRHW